MMPIPARARVGQPLAGHCGQSERVVEFTVGKQTGIGDHRSAKLEHQTSVEIDPQNPAIRFTRRVRHDRIC
jgi:hypothetical protein